MGHLAPGQDALAADASTGARLRLVETPAHASAADIVHALGLDTDRPVILIIGGSESFERDIPPESERRVRLRQLFGRSFVRAAADAGAVLVDGAADTGRLAMLWQTVCDQPETIEIVGEAPSSQIADSCHGRQEDDESPTAETEHTVLFLVHAKDWGGDTVTTLAVAAELAGTRPVVVVLVHGSEATTDELVRCARRDWPIIVVEGFGGLADQIAKLRVAANSSSSDARLDEVVADGQLTAFPSTEPPMAFGRVIGHHLGSDETVRRALELRDLYSFNANYQRDRFMSLQRWILILAVIGPLLALVHKEVQSRSSELAAFLGQAPIDVGSGLMPQGQGQLALKVAIVLVPLITAAVFAISVKFNPGASWYALRSSTEAIKAEVFRYRSRTGAYSDRETTSTSREQKLAKKLEAINQRVLRTAVMRQPPAGMAAKHDVGILTPRSYLAERLEEQRQYYQRQIMVLSRTVTRFWVLIILAGLVGSALAAFGFELWIAVTAASTAALIAYLQYLNAEQLLVGYNKAAAELTNVGIWWSALSADEERDPRSFDRLVELTETILAAESMAWRQQMEESVASLLQRQSPEATPFPAPSEPGNNGKRPASGPDAGPAQHGSGES